MHKHERKVERWRGSKADRETERERRTHRELNLINNLMPMVLAFLA